MKTLIAILVSIVLTVSFSVSAETHGQAMQAGQDGQMMAMMKEHMMCAQAVDGEMMGEHPMENDEKHDH